MSHALGETTIEAAPERIAAVGWANNEVPIALGLQPVGMSTATFGDDDGDGVLPWVKEALAEQGLETPALFDETDGLPFEDIAETEPDIILAAYSGLTEQDYETLSKIAPVVAYPDVPWGTTLEEIVTLNATALGQEEAGAELQAEIEGEFADAMAAHPALEGAKVLFTAFGSTTDSSQIGFYTMEDPRLSSLIDAGMALPQVVEEASEGTDQFWLERSAERPEDFEDVDLFITYGSDDDAENQALLEEMQTDPLLGRIPAIAEGRVAFLGNGPLAASATPSPLSVSWGVEEYFALLEDALTDSE